MNECFTRLYEQLEAFRSSRAVLLRWLVSREEVPWVESVLARGVDRLRFITLRAPFELATAHGHSLARELLAHLAGARPPNGPWRVPAISAGIDDGVVLAMLAESYARQACAPQDALLVLVLDPGRLDDVRTYARWVAQKLPTFAATSVRFLVLEDCAARPLAALERDPRVMTRLADLRLDEAVEALAERQDTRSLPGQVRVLLLRCMHASRRGDVEHAMAVGRAALSLVDASGLHELAVPVHFAIGAALMARSRFVEAVTSYRQAELAADRASSAGHAQGPELRILARLGVGSALIAAQSFPHAAPHLEETAKIAAAAGNTRLQVESLRLASYCHERVGASQRAWDAALAGLAVVAHTPANDRHDDGAREIGRTLMRLTNLAGLRLYRPGIEAQLAKHLGPNWDAPTGSSA